MDQKALTATPEPPGGSASRGNGSELELRTETRASLRGTGRPPERLESATRAAGGRDFDQLYDAHFDFVWRSLRLLGVPPELLEDAAQDAFSVVSRQLAQFEGRSALRTWIFAILQRVAANYRRTRVRKLDRLRPFEDAASHEPTPLAHAEALEAAAVIESFCAGLDPERRAVFVLALLEETPAPEIAAALGIPINTVYSRVKALRDGLRKALQRGEREHG
jgi:RNA polymerase sigma-70 factor (ECF subfamily)